MMNPTAMFTSYHALRCLLMSAGGSSIIKANGSVCCWTIANLLDLDHSTLLSNFLLERLVNLNYGYCLN